MPLRKKQKKEIKMLPIAACMAMLIKVNTVFADKISESMDVIPAVELYDGRKMQKAGFGNKKRMKTLNKYGYMLSSHHYDPIMEDFIRFSQHSRKPVLDGGAAYGVASIPALKKGATVIANDIELQHLSILANNMNLSDSQKSRLYLNPKNLVSEAQFPKNSLGGILYARVLHFFNPNEVIHLLEKSHQWLDCDGHLFISTMTPYHYKLNGFEKEYKAKMEAGNPWPGEIKDIDKYIFSEKGNIPDYLHVFDTLVLARVLTGCGFLVKKIFMFKHGHVCGHDHPYDYIGVIAVKK